VRKRFTFARVKRQQRSYACEQLEPRLPLTANAQVDELFAAYCAPPAADHAQDSVSAQATIDIGTLSGPQSFDGSVAWYAPTDWFAFDLKANSQWSARLSGLSADADVYLISGDGQVLGSSTNAGSASESLSATLDAGEYYVAVTGYLGASTNYSLGLNAAILTPLPAADTAGSTPATARDLGELASALNIDEFVGPTDTVDWFAFNVASSGQGAISVATADSSGLILALFDQQQHLVDVEYGGSTSYSGGLQAGRYYVLVYNAAEMPYELQLSFRADGAPDTPSDDLPNVLPDVANFGGSNDWNLNAINAPEAWAAGYTGQGITVAVIDTGVDLSHPDLQTQLWVNPGEIAGDGIDNDGDGYVDDVHGWDFVDDDNLPDDENMHGTHVAGTIAGANDGSGVTGVAYGATIMAVRVLDAAGSGDLADVAAGIRYAVDQGARIINLSLGAESTTSLMANALRYAQSHGVLVVAAAGNDGGATPNWPARYAASLDNVLSVGAYNSNRAHASFSNFAGSSGAAQVDAPGVNVYSSLPDGQYGRLSGTSMATPHVVGLAALALSANPNLTAAQLRTLIVDGADRTVSGSDSAGGINAAVTVAQALRLGAGATANAATANVADSASAAGVRTTVWTRAADAVFAAHEGTHARSIGEGDVPLAAPLNAAAADAVLRELAPVDSARVPTFAFSRPVALRSLEPVASGAAASPIKAWAGDADDESAVDGEYAEWTWPVA